VIENDGGRGKEMVRSSGGRSIGHSKDGVIQREYMGNGAEGRSKEGRAQLPLRI